MNTGADADEGASIDAPPRTAGDGLERLETDAAFAVIHDEPFITIVYENGIFWGTVVDGTLERLERAMQIASHYNLIIDGIRCRGADFDLHLTEVSEPD